MKSTITFLILLTSFNICQSQIEYLRLSPAQTIQQRVGMTDIELNYSRPQMKGRTVFGSLVPYNQMWRTGANENTTINFKHRVRIGKTEVEEGTYALFTKPDMDQWEIYLYTDIDNLDVPDPIDSTKLIYLTTVSSYQQEHKEETLVINFYDITETTATLGISWEHTAVRIPMTFYTHEAMEKRIEEELDQNIFDYIISSAYYAERDLELEKAKQLREVAMSLREKPSAWDHHSYGIILYKLGDKEKAIEYVKSSLKIAEATDNKYIMDQSQKLLAEWQ